MRRAFGRLAPAFIGLLLLAACGGTAARRDAGQGAAKVEVEGKGKGKGVMTVEKRFSDPEFEQVQPGSFLSYPCSPTDAEEDVDFRGIRLKAPAEVYFVPGEHDPVSGAFAPVIVCGMCCVSYDTLGLRGDFVESIVLVAVDVRTKRTYSGRMVVSRGSPARKPGPEVFGLTDEDLKDRVIVKFFNPNLAEVLGLPEAEAEYLVHATLGPYTSNVVRIRVRRAGAGG